MSRSSEERGLWAERVAYRYFCSRGYLFLSHRLKTPWAEVDLVLRSPQGVISLIEVKALGSWEYFSYRLSRRQKTRLLRAQTSFMEKEGQCLLMLAVVRSEHEVLVFDEVFR